MGGATHQCPPGSEASYISYADVRTFRWLLAMTGQSNMEYPLGTTSCWNQSNTDCAVKDAQCSFGCVENAGAEIKDMANYDNGMRLLIDQGFHRGFRDPAPDLFQSTGWLPPSKMGGQFSAAYERISFKHLYTILYFYIFIILFIIYFILADTVRNVRTSSCTSKVLVLRQRPVFQAQPNTPSRAHRSVRWRHPRPALAITRRNRQVQGYVILFISFLFYLLLLLLFYI